MRARIKGDITNVPPDAKIEANEGTDYKCRAKVLREAVAKALHGQFMAVTYPNFKSTVKEKRRHAAYMDVWSAMYKAQH